MADDYDAEVRKIADLITGYLINHPYAADTVKGIGKWWLTKSDTPDSLIETALECLIILEIVKRYDYGSGQKIYSSNMGNVINKKTF